MASLVGTATRRRAVVPGTFGRSLMAAAGRGLGLVGAAVLLGILLLQLTDDSAAPPPGLDVAAAGDSTTTTTTSAVDLDTGLRPPTDVQVLVLNAARVEGAASDLAEEFSTIGHPVLPAGNAPTQEETVVFFKPGFEREADAILSTVSNAAFAEPLRDPSPFAGTEEADLVVVLGTNFASS